MYQSWYHLAIVQALWKMYLNYFIGEYIFIYTEWGRNHAGPYSIPMADQVRYGSYKKQQHLKFSIQQTILIIPEMFDFVMLGEIHSIIFF